MWTKPWKFKEGTVMGTGLVITGLALQSCFGIIRWEKMAWPVNGILLTLLLGMILTMHCFCHRVYLFRYLSSYHAAISSLLWTVVLTIVMGLYQQVPSHVEIGGLLGIVGHQQMLSSWHLVLIYTWLTICLGLAILRVASECLSSTNRGKSLFRRLPFFISHLGLFIAVVAATLGSADMQRLQMACYLDRPEWRGVGYDNSGKIVELPFAIELHEFTMDEYESGMPKRFASDVTVYEKVDTDNGHIAAKGIIEVNKPLDVAGWKIYQSGYDSSLGTYSPYSIFELVKDPWLPAVYVGIYLLLLGAVVMIIQAVVSRSMKGRRSKITVIAIAIAFAVMAYFFIPIMTNKELMPALQSPWFAPHVLVYMFAYTLLAATVLLALWETVKRPKTSLFPIIDNLVYAGNALIVIGMLFGALWAKEAWGHYWSWDPKETWAAITWFAYLGYIHYRKLLPDKPKENLPGDTAQSRNSLIVPVAILIISFILLNMCWWGINFLPSAQATSVHTYNN